jgi:hypothetical protein
MRATSEDRIFEKENETVITKLVSLDGSFSRLSQGTLV